VADGRLRLGGAWMVHTGYFNPNHSWKKRRFVVVNQDTHKSWFAVPPTAYDLERMTVFRFSSPVGWPCLFVVTDEVT
jgi:hypothetical protein